jgi:hypothetical protein
MCEAAELNLKYCWRRMNNNKQNCLESEEFTSNTKGAGKGKDWRGRTTSLYTMSACALCSQGFTVVDGERAPVVGEKLISLLDCTFCGVFLACARKYRHLNSQTDATTRNAGRATPKNVPFPPTISLLCYR